MRFAGDLNLQARTIRNFRMVHLGYSTLRDSRRVGILPVKYAEPTYITYEGDCPKSLQERNLLHSTEVGNETDFVTKNTDRGHSVFRNRFFEGE
mgnify:CR=1 FL=1